jgi:hypothetical protein
MARLIEQCGADGKGAHASHSSVHAQIKEDIMIRKLLILLALASSPAYAQSCDPVRYPGSCKDKVMQYVQCIVKAETYRLRSLPSDNAQAVGDLSRGDTVYISDTNGSWIFVQGEETFEGKTEKTDGGWLPRSAVNNCRSTIH